MEKKSSQMTGNCIPKKSECPVSALLTSVQHSLVSSKTLLLMDKLLKTDGMQILKSHNQFVCELTNIM